MFFKFVNAVLVCFCLFEQVSGQNLVKGVVYHDLNKNGKREISEPGLPNVAVSNGVEVVLTNHEGFYELPVQEGMVIFVIKPSGYALPLDERAISQHFYLHFPQGSPETDVPGIAPTGELPASLDFGVWAQLEEDVFEVLLFGDPQARGLKEVNYISHDVVEECMGTSAEFGIVLGDIVADDPALFEEVSESLAQIGIPWYYTFGNHDHNRDVSSDKDRDGTFKRFFGPSSYALEYGEASFIVMRDVHFDENGKYRSEYNSNQLTFLEEYLRYVPQDKLVVLVQHIPLPRTSGKERLFELLGSRPNTLSISGHTHTMQHLFLGEEYGWHGLTPHHHFINSTVSGSWWCGLKDETGIPHATMNDGAPNGYSILKVNGSSYEIEFKAARRPESYQMNIFLPEDISAKVLPETEVLVNVFSGSEKSIVEMKVDDSGEWISLKLDPQPDPFNQWMHGLGDFLELELEDGRRADQALGWKMDDPRPSSHIWAGYLPQNLSKGTHQLTVRTKDMFGKEYTSYRIFRVR